MWVVKWSGGVCVCLVLLRAAVMRRICMAALAGLGCFFWNIPEEFCARGHACLQHVTKPHPHKRAASALTCIDTF